ncbi:LOW QUALITY PROTEIN: hypothetical protein YC2023_004545 [Brassica napus]
MKGKNFPNSYANTITATCKEQYINSFFSRRGKQRKPGTWVPVVASPRTAKYGPLKYKSNTPGLLRTFGSPRNLQVLYNPRAQTSYESRSNLWVKNDFRVLKTTSRSRRTSGFPIDLRVPKRPQGLEEPPGSGKTSGFPINLWVPKRPQGLEKPPGSQSTSGSQNDLRVLKTTLGFRKTFGSLNDLRRNLRFSNRPLGPKTTSGSKIRPHNPRAQTTYESRSNLRGQNDFRVLNTTSGSRRTSGVLNTTSRSRRTSGFPIYLRVPKRPQGLEEPPGSQSTAGSQNNLRVLKTTSGSRRTSGSLNDLRRNLRVSNRPLGPKTTSGSKIRHHNPRAQTTYESRSNLRVQNDFRALNTTSGSRRTFGRTSGFPIDLWVPKRPQGLEEPLGSQSTSGSKRPQGLKDELRKPPGSQSTSESQNDLRVLNTTSWSRGTSGFCIDLWVLTQPPGSKGDLWVYGSLRALETTFGSQQPLRILKQYQGSLDDAKEDTAPKSLPSNQRESTRRRRLRVEKIYGKVPLKVHTTIRFPDKNPYNLRVPGLRSMQATVSLTKVHPASGFLDESQYNLLSHPQTYGFQKDVSLNLQTLEKHA